MLISIIIVIVFAIIVIAFYPTQKKGLLRTSEASNRLDQEAVEKNYKALDKKSLSMMSYKEALAASKQFIYDITRAVIQKFTPDSQKEVSVHGKKLYDAGMEYTHVVDIFALSIEKNKTMNVKPVEKNQTISR